MELLTDRLRLAAVLVACGAPRFAQDPGAGAAPDWFETGRIPDLRLELAADDAERLQREPRQFVRARLQEDQLAAFDVGVKLKGSAGSFRDLADKPGLTIDVDRFETGREFHGLVKFYLNNAVQDGTYLHEDLAGELFRRAGLAAPRITHARVWLDGRDLGLYVLKEGYDRRFLERWFADAHGNLYDGGVNGEVHDDLDRDAGNGPLDRSDLKALAAACALPAGVERRRRIEACLDVDRFLTFMAAEVMIGHWDGYTLNPNNYRIYFPDRSRRGVFLIHGADQVFEDPQAELFAQPSGVVAVKVLEDPVWRDAYRQRVRQLLPLFHPPRSLIERIRQKAARLQAVAGTSMSAEFARELADAQLQLESRVVQRARFLASADAAEPTEVLAVPEPGVALATLPWRAQTECDDVELGDGGEVETAFTIRAGDCGACVGSWRTTVFLDRGRYEFRAAMTTVDVVAAPDEDNAGAGIRISGGHRSQVAQGSVTEEVVTFAFDVDQDRQRVVLVLELRASRGRVSFGKDALRLVRVE